MKNLSWKILLLGNLVSIAVYALSTALADSWVGLCWHLLYYSHVIGVVIACYATTAPYLHAALSCVGIELIWIMQLPFEEYLFSIIMLVIMQAGLAAGVWIAPRYRKGIAQLRAKWQARQG